MLARQISAASRSCATTTADLPPIPVYAAELNQVWTNLIDNAVDAMDGVGHAHPAHRRATATASVVEIADTGPGIPEDASAASSSPSSPPSRWARARASASTSPAASSSSGTTATSRSRPGPGRTTFRVSLPPGR